VQQQHGWLEVLITCSGLESGQSLLVVRLHRSVYTPESLPPALQGVMLDELDEDIEGTQTRLQAAQKRMNHVLKRAGMKGQICIVLGLVALLAVLVVVAFS